MMLAVKEKKITLILLGVEKGGDLWLKLHTHTHCTAGTARTGASHTTTGPDDTITSPKIPRQCPASNVVLASVITGIFTAIITALLATVVFLLAQFTVCKHFRLTPGAAESAAESAAVAGGEELAVYEEIDGDEGGGAEEGAVKLEKNAAYSVAIVVE